jgi:uncharacterized protein (TIGR02597 family)
MKLKTTIPSIAAALLAAAPIASAQNATTDPVGFVTTTIPAGTGSSKTTVFVSAPLYDTASVNGSATGALTGVSSNSLTNSAAGWTSGELSQASGPFFVQITSGNGSGTMLLIQSNTADTLTINSTYSPAADLTTLGIASGDSYRISPADTIESLFGTPADGVQGGTAQTSADTVQLVVNGSASTYFYKTDATPAARWTKVAFGNPDATNEPVLPNFGIQYSRLAATPLTLTATGSVPVSARQAAIKNSGATLLSNYWPTDTTLAALGLQNIPGWLSGANQNSADIVLTRSLTNGSSKTFFYNGTTWKQVGFGVPASSDNEPIPVGTSVRIFRKGSASGQSVIAQSAPYSL